MPFPIDFAGREEVEVDPDDDEVLDGYAVIRSRPGNIFSSPGKYWTHLVGFAPGPDGASVYPLDHEYCTRSQTGYDIVTLRQLLSELAQPKQPSPSLSPFTFKGLS